METSCSAISWHTSSRIFTSNVCIFRFSSISFSWRTLTRSISCCEYWKIKKVKYGQWRNAQWGMCRNGGEENCLQYKSWNILCLQASNLAPEMGRPSVRRGHSNFSIVFTFVSYETKDLMSRFGGTARFWQPLVLQTQPPYARWANQMKDPTPPHRQGCSSFFTHLLISTKLRRRGFVFFILFIHLRYWSVIRRGWCGERSIGPWHRGSCWFGARCRGWIARLLWWWR